MAFVVYNLIEWVSSLSFLRKISLLDIEMNKLVAATLENKVHLWDLREQHPKEGFAHHAFAHDR